MKTTTILIAASLVLFFHTVFASNEGVPASTNKEMILNSIFLSAPVTPKEATFEEFMPSTELSILAPVTPNEASFDDQDDDINITDLVPLTPASAYFNDDGIDSYPDLKSLAPVTPSEADFTGLN